MTARIAKLALLLALALPAAAALAQAAPSAPDCTAIPVLDGTLSASRIVMVGEVHGTREMPAMLVRMACRALKLGRTVSVGLEMMDTEGALEAYMASNGDAPAREAFLKARHWNGVKDGRSSVAWLGMIEALRVLSHQGRPVHVFALVDKPLNGGDRDRAMAARLRQEVVTHPDALVFTYTGNIHSMLKRASWLDARVALPMGAQVSEFSPVSIDLTSDGGQSWFCTGPGPGACGANELPGTLENGPPEVPQPARQPGVYTLQLNVGRTTASPPAVGTQNLVSSATRSVAETG